MEVLDYLVFVIYFLLLVSVGVLGMLRAKTSEQYMVADRNLGVWMLFGCLTAVFLGGSSTIGSSQLGYEMGLSGIWFVFSMGLGITLFGLLFLDRVMGYKLLTISELLGRLFGTKSKLIGAVVAAIYTLLISVTQIIAIGALLSGVFDWGLYCFLLYNSRWDVDSFHNGCHSVWHHDLGYIFNYVASESKCCGRF